ncbi:hypothetical protein C8J57DRAFT_1664428 [Mycena rebaudengoi]|nr:hypothetical protein C8J57DRAFT_1664428 [Mycena rebaudengoi]
MVKQRVLLLGATGETGGSILNGLLEDAGSFHVEALVRPSSKDKPEVQEIARRGVNIRVVDIEGPLDDVVKALAGVDVLISAIDATGQLAQLNLATAAKQAGVKRFVPCAFITVIPPGGVMGIRDNKEEVYQHIRKLYLPYTVIDVGYWHQLSFPPLPSGREKYAAPIPPRPDIHAGGNTPTMLTDLRDVGPFVARIIKDPRTLNKYVVTYSDVLSENEIFAIMEEMSGEVIERNYVRALLFRPAKLFDAASRIQVSTDEVIASRARGAEAQKAEPDNVIAALMKIGLDYTYSKYVRGDNTPEYAAYLGYLDTRALYPEFSPRSFRQFVGELLEGKAAKLYPGSAAKLELLNDKMRK